LAVIARYASPGGHTCRARHPLAISVGTINV
jgi:hypothetical protein